MSRGARAAVCLGLLALAWACYGGSLSHGWVWDDHPVIEHNELFARPRSASEVFHALAHPERGMEGAARPVFLASLLLDRRLWGLEPGGFHLTNLLLHAANACLVSAAALSLSAPPAAAVLAGALFAVHPVNSEAVSLPTFRPDLLCALFMLLGLLSWRRARRARSGAGEAAWLCACALSYLLGLLSKEMAASLPGLLLLGEAAFPRGGQERPLSRKGLAAALAVFCAAAGAYFFYRSPRAGYQALAPAAPSAPLPAPGAGGGRIDAPRLNRKAATPSPPQWESLYKNRTQNVMTMCGVFAEYERLLVWPSGLKADRVPDVISSPADARLWLSLLALLGAAALAGWAWRRGARLVFFGLGWCALSLIPVSNAVPLYNPIAERYLYVVTIGLALAVGSALEAAGRALADRLSKPGWAPLLGVLVLLPLTIETRLRERDWRSDQALLGSEAADADDSARVSYNLGVLAQKRADYAEAARRYERAIALNPRYVEALVNLGGVRERQDRPDDALALYRRALELHPTTDAPYLIYSRLLRQQGRLQDAFDVCQRLVREHPDLASGWLASGELELSFGGPQNVENTLNEAVKRDPSLKARAEHLIGLAYLKAADAHQGPYEPAWRHLAAASALAPADAETAADLGVALDHGGQAAKAVDALERAEKLSPRLAEVRYDRAVALNELGRVPPAEAELERAVSLAPAYTDAWYTLALLRQRTGDIAGAFQAYNAALKASPRKLEVLANLGALEEVAGNPCRAVELERRALSEAPDLPFLLNNYGNALLKCGRAGEAVGAFQAAAQKAQAAGDLNLTRTALANLAAARQAAGPAF